MKYISSEVPWVNKLCNAIILLPMCWIFSGLFLYPDGKKTIVILVIMAVFSAFLLYKVSLIKYNLKNNKLLWLLGAYALSSTLAYLTYGFSSSQLRAIWVMFIYLTIFPACLINRYTLKMLTLIGVVASLSYVLIQIYYYGMHGRNWSINPIPYATFSAILSILSLCFFFEKSNIKERTIWLLSFSMSMFPLFISQTRGVWLALAIAVSMLITKTLYSQKKNILLLLPLILLCVPPLYYNADKIQQRITSTTLELQKIEKNNLNSSFGLRLQMWKSTPLLLEKSPFLGQGDTHQDHKKELAEMGKIHHNIVNFTHYHNQFLNDLIKYGVLGFMLLLCGLALPLFYFFKYAHPERWGGVLTVAIFSIAALTDVPFQHQQTLMLYFITIYITLFSPRLKEHAQATQ